ncbi:MAG: hypothetical protein ACKVZ0_25495 [Gemmatimonadales bacterium]
MCHLIESQAGPIGGCTGSLEQYGSYEGILEIQRLLGVTDASFPPYAATNGIFAADETHTAFRQAQMSNGGGFAVAGVVQPLYDPDVRDSRYGHFLVRVPEPGTALLLACVMLALAGTRFSGKGAHGGAVHPTTASGPCRAIPATRRGRMIG